MKRSYTENYFSDLADHLPTEARDQARPTIPFEGTLEKKLFWIIFLALSLLADAFLPFFWGMIATLPIVVLSWWLVYRSGWLC
jgi:hypothetical protein